MFVLRPTRLFSAYVVVTYRALSGTAIFVTCGALSGTMFVLRPTRLFSAYVVTSGALSGTDIFVTYGDLSGTCYCAYWQCTGLIIT